MKGGVGVREIEERELRGYRCEMCGCKNKLVHDFTYPDLEEPRNIGYTYRCCNCGKVTEFFNPDIDCDSLNERWIRKENARCFQTTGCTHTTCPLHPKYEENQDHAGTDSNNSSTDATNQSCQNHCIIVKNGNSSFTELKINATRVHSVSGLCDKFR